MQEPEGILIAPRPQVRYTIRDGHLRLGTLPHRQSARRAGTAGALPAARHAGRRLRVAGTARLGGSVGAGPVRGLTHRRC